MLDLSPMLMVVVLAIFLFLLYRLNERLYRPLIAFMDKREATIAEDLKAADNLSSDTDSLLAQAREAVEKAKSEAAKMRQEAVEKVKSENEAALARRQSELEEEYGAFLTRLAQEREQLRSSVLSQLPLIKESLKAKFSQL